MKWAEQREPLFLSWKAPQGTLLPGGLHIPNPITREMRQWREEWVWGQKAWLLVQALFSFTQTWRQAGLSDNWPTMSRGLSINEQDGPRGTHSPRRMDYIFPRTWAPIPPLEVFCWTCLWKPGGPKLSGAKNLAFPSSPLKRKHLCSVCLFSGAHYIDFSTGAYSHTCPLKRESRGVSPCATAWGQYHPGLSTPLWGIMRE